MDYKNHEPGKYLEPEDRKTAKDFPSLEELFIYGEDIPVPGTVDELRYKYPFPPGVELKDLEGRKVPPLGLSYISKAGGGGRWGFVYQPGTFFEDKVTINKELGKSTAELTIIREQSIKNKAVQGMAALFEEKGLASFKDTESLDGEVVAAGLKWAFEMIEKSKNPREALNFIKYFWDKIEHKDKVLDSLAAREGKALDFGIMTMKMLDEKLAGLDTLIAREKGEVVDTEFFDVSGDPDSETDI